MSTSKLSVHVLDYRTRSARAALRDLRQMVEHCRYGQPYAQWLWAA